MDIDEIKDAVSDYLNDDLDNYAIMINGAWGTGKTYLYENHIKNVINKQEVGKQEDKRDIYISLYGVKTIQELSNELLANYIMFSKLRSKKKSEKVLEKTYSVISMIAKSVTVNVPFASIDVSNLIKEAKNLFEIKRLVICFDDFERCEIPINTLLGFINTLVEHHQCKVIILADESNIGKMYANTNLEAKYATILTGNRKIIFDKINPKKEENADDLTLSQLKTYNETLYTDNFLYRDIKEKVVRRTYEYRPTISKVLLDISGNNSKRIKKIEYRAFINKNAEKISDLFESIDCINLRVIFKWIKNFESLYICAKKRIGTLEYFEYIIEDFMKYSIWKLVSFELNEPLLSDEGDEFVLSTKGKTVHFDRNRYVHTYVYRFIDPWIISEIQDEKRLEEEAAVIRRDKQREDIYENEGFCSTGEELGHLRNWIYLEDKEINKALSNLLEEVKANKYSFGEYANILHILTYLKNNVGFDEIDVDEYIKEMQGLIKKDDKIYDIRLSEFDYEGIENQVKDLIELRKQRNAEINMTVLDEKGAYDSVKVFYEECTMRTDYYIQNRAFMDSVDIGGVIILLKKATLKEIYEMEAVFMTVYRMGNVKDFFVKDLDKLRSLVSEIDSIKGEICQKGKTYKFAIESFKKRILSIIERLE